MGALISGVTERVRAMAPDHEDQWTDAMVQSLIYLADLSVREEADLEWASVEIELVNGALYYAIPSDVIDVRSVEFSRDGITYDHILSCVSFEDMDDIDVRWQESSGTTPELFSILSAPGSVAYSKILIWRPLLSTSGEKIRINYIKSRTSEDSLAAVEVPDEVMEDVYLPYVLGLMRQGESPEEAMEYMRVYDKNIGRVKARYGHKTTDRGMA